MARYLKRQFRIPNQLSVSIILKYNFRASATRDACQLCVTHRSRPARRIRRSVAWKTTTRHKDCVAIYQMKLKPRMRTCDCAFSHYASNCHSSRYNIWSNATSAVGCIYSIYIVPLQWALNHITEAAGFPQTMCFSAKILLSIVAYELTEFNSVASVDCNKSSALRHFSVN